MGGAGLVHTPLVYSKLPGYLACWITRVWLMQILHFLTSTVVFQLDKMYRAEGVADFCRL